MKAASLDSLSRPRFAMDNIQSVESSLRCRSCHVVSQGMIGTFNVPIAIENSNGRTSRGGFLLDVV